MRIGYLSGVLALGALVIVSITPEPAQGCHWFNRGGGYGPGYGAAAPAYPAPPMYAPGPAYAPPGAYYTPGMVPTPAPGPRPMPSGPATVGAAVSAKDNSFDPGTLNVQVGSTVKWTNNGTHAHTVTSNDGKWDSGELAPGATYSVTFMTAGTYRYHCKLHKGMEGTIVVGEPGKAPVGGGSSK